MRGAAPADDAVLLQSPSQLTAHDPSTGKQLWSYKTACDGISSPTAAAGKVYVASKGATALNPAAAEPEVVWNNSTLQPGAASTIVHGDNLLAINRAGVLVCVDTAAGQVRWRVRLDGEFWGTPALAGNRLYCVSHKGAGQVVEISADGASR